MERWPKGKESERKEEGKSVTRLGRTNPEAASYHTHNAHAMEQARRKEELRTALICPKGPYS